MGNVLPGRSWSCNVDVSAGGSFYGVLGPFSESDFIRRVGIHYSAIGVQSVVFCGVIGASEQGNAAALTAGRSLISRSSTMLGGVPSWQVHLIAGSGSHVWIPLGFQGGTGSQWIVGRFFSGGAVSSFALFTADVLRIVRPVVELVAV
ncbi:MAG: hypothetical protein V3S19_07195 [Gemmatimonadales bacterium]